MEPTDRLCMLDRNELPNRPIFQQKLPQKHVVRAVPEDMTGREDFIWTVSSAEADIYILTVLKSRCSRLLTQHVHFQRTKRLQDPLVRLVLGAKDDPVNPSIYLLAGSFSFSSALLVFEKVLPRIEILVLAWCLIFPNVFLPKRNSF